MGLIDKITKIFLDNTLRWIIVAAVIILNFITYFQNPTKYAKNGICLGIPCKWSNYLTTFINFTIDILIVMALWFTIPFSSSLPSYWLIPFVVIGYTILTDTAIGTKQVEPKQVETKQIETEQVENNEELNPPPEHMKPKKGRLSFHRTIILLDIIILAQFYLYATKHELISKTIFYGFIKQLFSGLGEKAIQMVVVWVGLLNIILDYYLMRQSASFQACKYDLPKSWNI